MTYYNKHTWVEAWSKLFRDIAEVDEENAKSIEISLLKENITEKTDSELEGDFGITRTQLKRSDLKTKSPSYFYCLPL